MVRRILKKIRIFMFLAKVVPIPLPILQRFYESEIRANLSIRYSIPGVSIWNILMQLRRHGYWSLLLRKDKLKSFHRLLERESDVEEVRSLLILNRFDIYDDFYREAISFLKRNRVLSFEVHKFLLGALFRAAARNGDLKNTEKFLRSQKSFRNVETILEFQDEKFREDPIYRPEKSTCEPLDGNAEAVIRRAHFLITTGQVDIAEGILDDFENFQPPPKQVSVDMCLSRYNIAHARGDSNALDAFNYFLKAQSLTPCSVESGSTIAVTTLAFHLSPDTRKGPLVSVIMPVHNNRDTAGQALQSLINQTYRNIEILIFDDESTDGTESILKEKIRSYRGPKKIRYFRNTTNVGPYVGRNAGILLSKGRYITFNDGDDFSHPQRIAKQVATMRRRPNIFYSHARGIRVMRSGRVDIQTWYPHGYVHFPGACLMFRRKLVETVGLYDNVRFDADFEFNRRLDYCLHPFQRENVGQCLYFADLSDVSLTSSGDGRLTSLRTSEVRLEYKKRVLEAYKSSKRPSDILVDCKNVMTVADYSGLSLEIDKSALRDVLKSHGVS